MAGGSSATATTLASLLSTQIEDGQGAGAITPLTIRNMAASLVSVLASQKAANYTLVAGDQATCIEMTSSSAATVTIPVSTTTPLPVGFVVEICQFGAGQVTIAAAGGVTLRSSSSLVTRAQYSTVSLRQRATDDWILSGDIA